MSEWEGEWDGELGGSPTPEDAATSDSDIPPRYMRVGTVTYSADGAKATVELLTNEEPRLYPYFVQCVRDPSGLWHALLTTTDPSRQSLLAALGQVAPMDRERNH
jgi:hypothetical protein